MKQFPESMDGKAPSLAGLTMFDFSPEKIDAHLAKMEAERQAFRDKYGDRWQEEYSKMQQEKEESIQRKIDNCRIYTIGAYAPWEVRRLTHGELESLEARMRELFGDRYDELTGERVDMDPRIGELLIAEALRTGRRNELPNELLAEYDKRVEGLDG